MLGDLERVSRVILACYAIIFLAFVRSWKYLGMYADKPGVAISLFSGREDGLFHHSCTTWRVRRREKEFMGVRYISGHISVWVWDIC